MQATVCLCAHGEIKPRVVLPENKVGRFKIEMKYVCLRSSVPLPPSRRSISESGILAKDNARMDAKDNIERIQFAIQQLIEEKRGRASAETESFVVDDEDQLLLSRLLSQLDSLKEDKSSKPPQPPSETKELPCSAIVIVEAKDETVHEPGSSSTETGTEEIVRELRKVKRQNSITHWLLSVMIILTAVWQLSEVSLILAVKNRVTDPFRSFGSMVKGMLKVCGVNERVEAKMKPSSSTKKPQIEAPSLPAFKIPELDLPVLGLNSEED